MVHTEGPCAQFWNLRISALRRGRLEKRNMYPSGYIFTSGYGGFYEALTLEFSCADIKCNKLPDSKLTNDSMVTALLARSFVPLTIFDIAAQPELDFASNHESFLSITSMH
eukprot:2939470-Ditylum_brightwellii.AAC.1